MAIAWLWAINKHQEHTVETTDPDLELPQRVNEVLADMFATRHRVCICLGMHNLPCVTHFYACEQTQDGRMIEKGFECFVKYLTANTPLGIKAICFSKETTDGGPSLDDAKAFCRLIRSEVNWKMKHKKKFHNCCCMVRRTQRLKYRA